MAKNPPRAGDGVQSLVREDRTCYRAAEPVSHDYSAHTLEPVRLQQKPPQREALAARRETSSVNRGWRKLTRSSRDPAQPETMKSRNGPCWQFFQNIITNQIILNNHSQGKKRLECKT